MREREIKIVRERGGGSRERERDQEREIERWRVEQAINLRTAATGQGED